MDVKKQLGEKIKRLRKKNHFTQEKLAEIIEIAPRNLVNIENGVNFPKADTLEKILKALNTSMQKLFETDSLAEDKELLSEIYKIIDFVQKDRNKLEQAYKRLKNQTFTTIHHAKFY